MVKKSNSKKSGEALGISGFTLGIVSIVLVIFTPLLGIAISILGFIFCVIQQKRKPTKLGKSGLILNVIGFVANMAWLIVLIKYIIPLVQEQLNQLA
jgi:hypothetical protein|tara:strand:+ start:2938 stop:3228 length:291 start_codon:yes stop_codon:yes gene_type:complete